MNFEVKKVSRISKEEARARQEQLKQYVIYGAYSLVVIILISFLFIYSKYIKNLPNISEIENQKIPEASTIYDRNGKEIYSIYYGEKRTYVKYDEISKNMVNAIVSTEDNTFFENSGFDIKGIFRSVFNYIFQKTSKIEGTSTISQQLIKNMMLTNERSLERKIKEVRLSYKLNTNYSKEKILELYLNKIAYGSNSYGIEQASRTFFGKSAKDLGILDSSILASLPKGPTYYSPYNHYDRLVGYPYTYNSETPDETTKLITTKDLDDNAIFTTKLKDIISSLSEKRLTDDKMQLCGIKKKYYKASISLDSDNCSIMSYSDLLSFLNNIQIKGSVLDGSTSEQKNTVFEYQSGRKDFVLQRMLEDKKITFADYQKAFIDGLGMTFGQVKEDIKYPHFVMYVKEYLENKYGKSIMESGGFKIYTTLDSSLQDKAQELVTAQVKANKAINATNAAMVSVDNRNGGILAMIGGADYFDREKAGNVNVITSKRQVGSSIKPLVYSLAIEKNAIGTQSAIYDTKTTFPGDYAPNNYDGKFMGKMNIMTALNYSRNVPAIKMYFLAGQQGPIINYLESLGINSLNKNFYYGAPLAIGAAEIEPIEMASAYSVFANMGYKKEITPILKILDSKGVAIESLDTNINGEKVIDPKLAYIMNYILSASETRPNSFWNKYLTLNGRKACAKTGTSNKVFMTNGKKSILPGDIWTAGYTPQITTIVWGGNNDGSALSAKGDGIAGAGPIWKGFMEYAHKGLAKEDWIKPDDLKTTYVSKITGYPVSSTTGSGLSVGSYFYNIPKTYDSGTKAVQVDALCNGKVTDATPPEAIKTMYIMQNQVDIEHNQSDWKSSYMSEIDGSSSGSDILVREPTEVCERTTDSSQIAFDINTSVYGGSISLGKNIFTISYSSNTPIQRIDLYAGDKKINSVKVENLKKSSVEISGDIKDLSQKVKVVLIDENYYSNSKYVDGSDSTNIDTNTGTTQDTSTSSLTSSIPDIIIKNPASGSIKIFEDQSFNFRFEASDKSGISAINLTSDGKEIITGLAEGTNVYAVEGKELGVGNHILTVEVINNNFSKNSKDISVEVLAR
ncbi:MAG: transglycosylase domain-containing protein [Candidatus Gracilibacteria bacterium]|nr:transglycosylase domain-containing protein [Candidatus Gracilibacteria bacterium]